MLVLFLYIFIFYGEEYADRIPKRSHLWIQKQDHRSSTCRITTIILFLIVLICYSGQGRTAEDLKGLKPQQFEIAGSQLLKIESTVTGQEYILHINLPQKYGDTSRTFPVVYLLDSQWDFPLVTAIYGDQYYDGFMPNAIIAGITWGGDNPDYDKRRAFDLTPTDGGQPAAYGNAAKFLSFIKEELIPFVESKFRTNRNDRTLMGHSFGGLFTLYTLFNETELFNKYIAGSSAWAWDQGSLYKFTEKLGKTKLTHSVRLYTFIGEFEAVAGFERLATTIRDFQVKDLILETKVIQGSGHVGTKPEGFNRGLQYVFTRPCLIIDRKFWKDIMANMKSIRNL